MESQYHPMLSPREAQDQEIALDLSTKTTSLARSNKSTNTVMSPVSSQLDAIILFDQLPDRHSELSIQKLDTFELFLELPKEIRFMIWRLTWIGHLRLLTCGRIRDLWKFQLRTYLPASAMVHEESRQETLKHYNYVDCFPEGPSTKGYSFRRQSFYFNPDIDTFGFEDSDLERRPQPLAPTARTKKEQIHFFRSVRRVRVYCRFFVHLVPALLDYNEMPALCNVEIYQYTSDLTTDLLTKRLIWIINFGGLAQQVEGIKAPSLSLEQVRLVDAQSKKLYCSAKDANHIKERALKTCEEQETDVDYFMGANEIQRSCSDCLLDIMQDHLGH